MKTLGQQVPTKPTGLDQITPLAHEWHGCYLELSRRECRGKQRLIRRLGQLEDMMEDFWQRRRRWLALAYQAALPASLAVDPISRDFLGEPMHIAPVC